MDYSKYRRFPDVMYQFSLGMSEICTHVNFSYNIVVLHTTKIHEKHRTITKQLLLEGFKLYRIVWRRFGAILVVTRLAVC